MLDTGIRKIPFSQIPHHMSTVPIIQVIIWPGLRQVVETSAGRICRKPGRKTLPITCAFTGKYKDLTLRDVKENAEYSTTFIRSRASSDRLGKPGRSSSYLIDKGIVEDKKQGNANRSRPSARTTGRYSNKPTDRREEMLKTLLTARTGRGRLRRSRAGAAAGPVAATAVILPPEWNHPLLNDSKQMSEKTATCYGTLSNGKP